MSDVLSSESVNKFIDSIRNQVQDEAESGRTWVQHMYHQVEIMNYFVRAERSGDWHLHFLCIKRMLPYLHASAHTNYAKSAHMYLQNS